MKRILAKTFLGVMAFASIMSLQSCAKASLTIASQGKSTFTIVIPADAPSSVQEAADELQKDIQLSTGAKLPVLKDDAKIATPIINLGNTKQAAKAGIALQDLRFGAFRLLTKEGNLYITGKDTADGRNTPKGGFSRGSANGVYTFLQDYLNVRWLMPGDIGRDVPRKSTFEIPALDRTVTPVFNWRTLGSHLHDYSNQKQWQNIDHWEAVQRLGGSAAPSSAASFWRTINGSNSTDVHSEAVQKLYKEHPTWFAMNEAGKRPAPQRKYDKLETTNPQLVQWFAKRKIELMEKSPKAGGYVFSLSPSDGHGWSKSAESKALYDPSPTTIIDPEVPAGDPNMTSLVLTWYRDVAQAIAQKKPDVTLGGYLYAAYLFPPVKYKGQLPSNFVPTIAMSPSYGYGLYREDTQKQFHYLMDHWGTVIAGNWYYYDLPNILFTQHPREIGSENNFPGTTALISPPASGILNTIFNGATRNHISGMILYSAASWSNTAIENYIMAQLMWNPQQDATDIRNDWLRRAYGPQAESVMEKFYTNLDGWFKEYYQHSEAGSRLTRDLLQGIYTKHYGEMEQLFLEAAGKQMTRIEKQRLQMVKDNLIVLQWRMRNADIWPEGLSSQLTQTDAQVNDLIVKTTSDSNFNYFPGAISDTVVGWVKPKPFPWKVEMSDKPADKSTFTGLKDGQFLLYTTQDGNIQITPELVKQGQYFAAYNIRNQAGELLSSGLFYKGGVVTFPAKAGNAYYLLVIPRKPVNYRLQISHATIASVTYANKILSLHGKPAPVLVFSPSDNVGIMEKNGSVVLQKPYAGAMAESLMKSYTGKHVLYSFDDAYSFSPDPQNDGIKRGVLQLNFDDSAWKKITLMNWWQDQGFPNYYGAAWYRIPFDSVPLKENERVRLLFGAVDGNVEIYLNGKEIPGHTLEAPDYEGWNKPFSRYVSQGMLKDGKNILAIKVTSKNATSATGIIKGVALVAGVPMTD